MCSLGVIGVPAGRFWGSTRISLRVPSCPERPHRRQRRLYTLRSKIGYWAKLSNLEVPIQSRQWPSKIVKTVVHRTEVPIRQVFKKLPVNQNLREPEFQIWNTNLANFTGISKVWVIRVMSQLNCQCFGHKERSQEVAKDVRWSHNVITSYIRWLTLAKFKRWFRKNSLRIGLANVSSRH